MVLIDVPANLVGHHADMVAINPVFLCVILKILAITCWENGSPECFEIGWLLFGCDFSIFIHVHRTAKLYGMLDAHHDEDRLVGITADIQMFLMVISSFGVSGIITLIELFLMIVVIQEFAIPEVEINLHPLLGEGNRPEPIGS